MDEQNWQELLAGYVLGDLSSAEMEQVQQYLSEHPEAQTEVEALRATLNLLPLSLPKAEPPARVRERLQQSAQQGLAGLAAAPRSQRGAQGREGGRRSPSRWRTWSLGLGSAAAAAIALLGVQNHRLQQNLAEAQKQHEAVLAAVETRLGEVVGERDRYQALIALLRQPNNRLLPIQGDGLMEVSSGSLVIAPQKRWAVLTLQNLPKPPAGKAYQLWATVAGEKIYCVEFQPDTEGKVLVEIPVGGWSSTPMVAITLEDEGTIPEEASEMVMNSPVI